MIRGMGRRILRLLAIGAVVATAGIWIVNKWYYASMLFPVGTGSGEVGFLGGEYYVCYWSPGRFGSYSPPMWHGGRSQASDSGIYDEAPHGVLGFAYDGDPEGCPTAMAPVWFPFGVSVVWLWWVMRRGATPNGAAFPVEVAGGENAGGREGER